MKKIFLGYLSFVNEKNSHRRLTLFKDSLESFCNLNLDSVCFTSFDNDSIDEVKNLIVSKGNFDKLVHLDKNYYDIAGLYGAYYFAKKEGLKYFSLLYDDLKFLGTDEVDYFKIAYDFLEENKDIDTLRMMNYDFENSKKYNTRFTKKQINPDSVNHTRDHRGKAKLNWEKDSQEFEGIKFYTNDWHYTSRFSIYRVKSFDQLFDQVEEIPVLNLFEKYCYNFHDKAEKNNKKAFKAGVMDKSPFVTGASHTAEHSERINLGNAMISKIKINKNDLNDAFEKTVEDKGKK